MGCLSPVVGVPKTEAPCDLDMIHIMREDSRGTEWPAACRPINEWRKTRKVEVPADLTRVPETPFY
jgi:hypothetical protein